jgi:hypothetical protein
MVGREQDAVGNPVEAPKHSLHPRQQHPAEQQLLSEDGVEHNQGDEDSVPDPNGATTQARAAIGSAAAAQMTRICAREYCSVCLSLIGSCAVGSPRRGLALSSNTPE